MDRILKSPALHFVLIGSLFFVGYNLIKPDPREKIVVTQQTIDAIVQGQSELQQHEVSDDQRESIIRSHIEDEILLKIAYDQGLERNDYRVRKRVLSLVRASLTEVVPEPSYAQLRAYYEENQEQFRGDTAWSFKQVIFNFTNNEIPENGQEYVDFLNTQKNTDNLGDFMGTGGGNRTNITYNQMAVSYGKNFAEVVIAAPMNEWTGPIKSILGVHYIKKTDRKDPELPPFEQVEDYLRQDYTFSKTRELQEQKILDLAQEFDIVVNGEIYKLQ